MTTTYRSKRPNTPPKRWRHFLVGLLTLAGLIAISPVPVEAGGIPDDDPVLDDGSDDGETQPLTLVDRSPSLEQMDARDEGNNRSSRPRFLTNGRLQLVGKGERNAGDATTDVWVHRNYAYTGTFNSPCGGEPDAGIWVWNLRDRKNPRKVGVIASPDGSRTNDVRVAAMNSGDILVHSNESCDGGPGGFEIYSARDPRKPVHLASVRIDELNPISDALFGGVTDVGVHNLFLFKRGRRDYVAVTAESVFDNFRVYEITNPKKPKLVTTWGAEELFDPGVGEETVDQNRVLAAALDLLSGFGGSQNKFLHDVTISDDGRKAYLANWDAGLVLLDINDKARPKVVSVAIDPVNGSLDGEVNSHSVWPSDDGKIVIEGEEDFSAWEGTIPPSNLTLDGTATPGDPTIPGTAMSTSDGDFFEANQVGLTGSTDGSTVVVDGGDTYDVVELATAAASPTFADTGPVSGQLVWIGRACTLTAADALLNTDSFGEGDIAVVRRGACEFQEKADAAASIGASAVVIANNQQSTPWSGLRLWDYSDPKNPKLASTFNTTCSASTAPSDECAANGTYSAHNVQIENRGRRVMAYISWYWDGMLVLDVTDPYNPIEVARYLDTSGPNAGLVNDFWGVHLPQQQGQWLYASDRNGGLYIFRLRFN